MNVTDLKTDPALLQKIETLKEWKPSAEELRKQRISFIIGSLGKSSSVTREKIEDVLNMQVGTPA